MTLMLEQRILDYFSRFERKMTVRPLVLGGYTGIDGGIGGPPGGFVGLLPQTRVAYDLSELALSGTPPTSGVPVVSGATLLDNLNHIRYRLVQLEGNPITYLVIEEDGGVVASGVQLINFEGDVNVVADSPTEVTVTISGGGNGGSALDKIIAVQENDGGTLTYSGTSTGLTNALADAVDGRTIFVPPGQFTSDYTVPDNVALIGATPYHQLGGVGDMTKISGEVTVNDNTKLQNLFIYGGFNKPGQGSCVTISGGGSVEIWDCRLECWNTDGNGTGLYGLLGQSFVRAFNTWFKGYGGGGSSNYYGVHLNDGTSNWYFNSCVFEGTQADIAQSAGTLEVIGCDFTTTSGTVVSLQGDRGAFDTDNYPTLHAKDLKDSLPVYHLPTATISGQIPVWLGAKWFATTPSGTGVTDHGLLTGLTDDDHTQYLNESRHNSLDHSTAMGTVVIDDISDVSITSPQVGEALIYSGGAWINSTISGTGVSDHGLLVGLADDDHTQYLNTTRHDTEDHSTAMSTVVFNDISDINITSVGDDELLQYDNGTSKWINQTLAEAGVSAVGHTHVEANITDLDHDADKIKGVTVDDTLKADGWVLGYESSSGNIVYMQASGIGSQGWGGDIYLEIPGALSATTGVASVIAARNMSISSAYIYVGTPGSAGSTVIDINKNGTSIYPVSTKPTVAYDDGDQKDERVPDTTAISKGDILSIDIDSVATGAEDLTLALIISQESTHSHTMQAIYTVEGDCSVAAIPLVLTNLTGTNKTISKVHLRAGTAPTGSGIIADIHKNGTTIFTTQANRPVILATAYSGYSTSIDVPAWNDGEELTAEIDQIGSTIAGANLVITVVYS